MSGGDLPDVRTQVEFLLVRLTSSVIPNLVTELLAERQAPIGGEVLAGLEGKIAGMADDHELRLYLLERATVEEAHAMLVALGWLLRTVRDSDPSGEAFQAIARLLLSGASLNDVLKLALRSLSGRDS